MKIQCTTVFLCLIATVGVAQTDSSRAIACATTNIMSEKAMCAWDKYREEAVWVARAISKALLVVDGYQGSMQPDDPEKARDLLVTSQEAWEVYREATCALETHLYFGGDGAALGYAQCLHRLTEARAKDLKVLLQEE